MNKLEITFYLKVDKKNNDGLAPIYCRIRINNSECTFSTGYMADPVKWKKLKQYRHARTEHDLQVRAGINQLHGRAIQTIQTATSNKISITVKELKMEILKPGSINLKREYTLLEAFKAHYEDFKMKVSVGARSDSTLSKFNTTKNHIIKFMKWKYNAIDFPIEKLNFDFINSFHWYMRTEAKCSHNYSVRRCEFLKSVIKLTRTLEWMEKDPFIRYSEKRKPVDTVYLTDEELTKLITTKLTTDKHIVVRDLFLFTVFTGYAGVDVLKLTPQHVIKHVDGKQWIFTKRQKTNVDSNVPLLKPALEIINKYKNDSYCSLSGKLLPKRSNQKINKYLKEIATIVGIKKKLHYYVARHTFATTVCLANGVSLEALSKMMGHKRITQTQHYARILNTMVSAEMILLDDKLLATKLFSQFT